MDKRIDIKVGYDPEGVMIDICFANNKEPDSFMTETDDERIMVRTNEKGEFLGIKLFGYSTLPPLKQVVAHFLPESDEVSANGSNGTEKSQLSPN